MSRLLWADSKKRKNQAIREAAVKIVCVADREANFYVLTANFEGTNLRA